MDTKNEQPVTLSLDDVNASDKDRIVQLNQLLTQLEILEQSGNVPISVLTTIQEICQSFLQIENKINKEGEVDKEIMLHLEMFSTTNSKAFNDIN